jgi:phosphoribosylanthranilate isomerase
MPIKIKICCISSRDEATLAMQSGADALGLVARMPSGPGTIGDEEIAHIAAIIPDHIQSFLLTSETEAAEIIAHHHRTQTNTIQLVDAMTEGSHTDIKKQLPEVKLVQVIHVIDESSVEEALAAAETADYLLLDSGNPKAAVKELGGTGRTHNWQLSRSIVEQSGIPVFLAGGLNTNNVLQAIETVQPFGIDLCSSVRTNGKLDPVKLEQFMRLVRK